VPSTCLLGSVVGTTTATTAAPDRAPTFVFLGQNRASSCRASVSDAFTRRRLTEMAYNCFCLQSALLQSPNRIPHHLIAEVTLRHFEQFGTAPALMCFFDVFGPGNEVVIAGNKKYPFRTA
jgi:hypothetical protein